MLLYVAQFTIPILMIVILHIHGSLLYTYVWCTIIIIHYCCTTAHFCHTYIMVHGSMKIKYINTQDLPCV